jgi:hypothetical protein
MPEDKNDETYIKKKRTTALKIIVDEKTKKDPLQQRTLLGTLFDFPEFTHQEEDTVRRCTVTKNGEPQTYDLYPEMLDILKENNIDPSSLIGYTEEKKMKFTKGLFEIDRKVKEATGMTDDTSLHYRFSSSEENNGVTIHYLRFELETQGKTKTEIKTVHKNNVSKLLHYLRMRKVPVSYDCEWSFEGNRACQL